MTEIKEAMRRWMSSFDVRWEFWRKAERTLKEKNFSCDLLGKPLDLIHVGTAHCSKGQIDKKIIVEVPKDPKITCRIVVLNATKQSRERIAEAGRVYDVTEYDQGRFAKGEPFDMEFHVPCNLDDIQREVEFLQQFGLGK